MSFTLRPYQNDILDKVRAYMRQGVRSILIQAPTGSGKTAITAHMLGTSSKKGLDSWFSVHRRELIKQSIRAFAEVNVKHGVVAAGFVPDPRQLIQIASIQTLARRYDRMRKPKLVIWDECHHIAAGTWAKIYSALPEAFHIGLTATPERLDGTGLSQWFQKMVSGPSTAELIKQGYLSPYRLFAPPGMNLGGLHTRMGDYITAELNAVADKPTITGDAIKHYLKHAAGKRAVVFCCSIEHSKHVVSQFSAAGIPAVHVDGETDMGVRDEEIEKFREGRTKILSNVELFGEGFDLPAIECGILLRPTQSLGLFLQQVGRTLRPASGKTVSIILDHAGNCQRHGLPDEDRIWTLDGVGADKNNSEADGKSIRICPKCFAAQFPGLPVCRFCGFTFKVESREVEQVEGDLEEVDPEVIRAQKKQEQSKCWSIDDLVKLGKERGYPRPYLWAKHVFNARQRKKLAAGRV
jgi:superfamily II DNA or RNA helicase